MGSYTYAEPKNAGKEPVKEINPTVSSLEMKPNKPTGMPKGVKITMILFFIIVGGIFLFLQLGVKWHPITNFFTKPAVVQKAPDPKSRILFHPKEVIIAKCKDFTDISLYLESNISQNDYNTTLEAMVTLPSKVLVVVGQEITYKSPDGNLKVYQCQVVKDGKTGKSILMGKLKRI